MKLEEEMRKLRRPLEERLPEDVCLVIRQAIGEASMCWEKVENAGTFKVEDAGAIVNELCHYVADLLDEAREEAGDDEAGYVTGEGVSLKIPMTLLQITEKMKATVRGK